MKLTRHQIIGLELVMDDMADQQLVRFFTENDYLFKEEGVCHLIYKAIAAQQRIDDAEAVQETEEASLEGSLGELEEDVINDVVAEQSVDQRVEQEQAVVGPETVAEFEQHEVVQETAKSYGGYTEEQNRIWAASILRKNRCFQAAEALEMDLETASRQRLEWIFKILCEALPRFDRKVKEVMETIHDRAKEKAPKAFDDNGQFEKELAEISKAGRREKAVSILRNKGYDGAADVVLGEADPEEFFDQLKEVAESEDIFSWIKRDWIYPILNEVQRQDAICVLENWAKEIAKAAKVMKPGADRQSAHDASDVLKNTRDNKHPHEDLDLRPYLREIDCMVADGTFPPTTVSLLHGYSAFEGALESAQEKEKGRRAVKFLNGIYEAIQLAVNEVFSTTGSPRRSGYGESNGAHNSNGKKKNKANA